jgi:serine/threonine-protein kinase HipA
MITLKDVPAGAKYENYGNAAYKKLFGKLSIRPILPFSKAEFFIESPQMVKGMSISGVQQKLSLKIVNKKELQITSINGEYILKPTPMEFPFASENEHCAMLSGALLGIETAQCGLIAFSDGELAYITKRFDRTVSGKLHQEDLVQGFNMASEKKYEKSYESAGQLVKEMCGGRLGVVLEYFKRVVHAYLIGNDDMHLKNISLMRKFDNSGKYYDFLTPNYDTLFTFAFDNHSTYKTLALDLLLEEETQGEFSEIYEQYGFYTGVDFKELGLRLGLTATVIASYFNFIQSKKEQLLMLIKNSYMPMKMKQKTSEIVLARLKALAINEQSRLRRN